MSSKKVFFFSRTSVLVNNWLGIYVYFNPRMHCEEEILFDLSSYSTLLMIFAICNVFDEILTRYIVKQVKI